MTASFPGIITCLICHLWDLLVLMAEIPEKYFLFSICPTAIHSFLCISLLIFLRLKCLSHYEIFIFSIPLAYGSVSLLKSSKGNLNLLNASQSVSELQHWRRGSTACPLGPLSCLLGTHHSLKAVPMGRSIEDIKTLTAAQPSPCLLTSREAGVWVTLCLLEK